MTRIKVIQLNPNRLKKIRRELDFLSNQDFFKTIPLAEYERLIAEALRDFSPRGSSGYRDYLINLGFPATGALRSFADSWRTKRETEGTRVFFKVWNLLNTSSGSAGKAKFAAVEYGTKASTWIASRTFRFKSKGDWITIKEGRPVAHAETKGAEVQRTVADYVEGYLLPRIGADVEALIAKRMV
jgi:hypothetical protein